MKWCDTNHKKGCKPENEEANTVSWQKEEVCAKGKKVRPVFVISANEGFEPWAISRKRLDMFICVYHVPNWSNINY